MLFKGLFNWLGRKIVASADFEGASTSRRMRTWGTADTGPTSVVTNNIKTLRSRSRQLERNNPHAKSAVQSKTANMIGRGITPMWRTGSSDTDSALKALWDRSVNELDFAGTLDFYGLQAQITTCLQVAGEVLVHFKYLRNNKNMAVPVQLQVLEADHLYDDMDTTLPNGNTLRCGIEFNQMGKRVAYWIYKEHPNETNLVTPDIGKVLRIAARDMLHIFMPDRPGQIRGVPWLTSIITTLRQLDEYEDAELARKKVAAMFGAFVTSPVDENSLVNIVGESDTDTANTDSEDDTYTRMEPAMIQYLAPGEDVKLAEPADVGGNFEVWIKHVLHTVAAGMGVTYEQLTGDLTGVSYSSIRAGLIEFRRRCTMLQKNILMYQFCRPVVNKWLSFAYLNDSVPMPGYLDDISKYRNVIWYPDGWDWVDPVKDVQGEKLAVRCGFKSRTQVVSEHDRDPVELDAEIQADNKRADSAGLEYESDPRKMSSSGVKQKADTGGSDGGDFGGGDFNE